MNIQDFPKNVKCDPSLYFGFRLMLNTNQLYLAEELLEIIKQNPNLTTEEITNLPQALALLDRIDGVEQ